MTIENSLDRRDMAVDTAISLRYQIGEDGVGLYHLEDLENLSPEDIRKTILEKMDSDKKNTLIFTGWIFTKEIYRVMSSYYDYEINDQESNLYIVTFLEFPLFVVTNSKEIYIDNILKKLNELQFKYSSLNIKDVVESDNGVQINYLTHTTVKLFEQKPEIMQ